MLWAAQWRGPYGKGPRALSSQQLLKKWGLVSNSPWGIESSQQPCECPWKSILFQQHLMAFSEQTEAQLAEGQRLLFRELLRCSIKPHPDSWPQKLWNNKCFFFPLIPDLLRIFIVDWHWILSNSFLHLLRLLYSFYPFFLVRWWITLLFKEAPRGCNVLSLLYIIGFNLLIFSLGFLYLCGIYWSVVLSFFLK